MIGLNEITRKNLKIYRKMRKMTQKDLAAALDVTHSSVSAWEIGKNSIDLDRLNEICEILDVTLEEVMTENLDAEAVRRNQENKELIEYLTSRPEVRNLLEVTKDSRNDDIIVAVKVLEALKKR